MIAEINGSSALTAAVPTSTRRNSKRSRKTTSAANPAAFLAFLRANATEMVTINLNIPMPAENWVYFARVAKLWGKTIEEVIADQAWSDEVIEESDNIACRLRRGEKWDADEPEEKSQFKITIANAEWIEEQARRCGMLPNQYLIHLARTDIEAAKKASKPTKRSKKGGAR